MRFDILTIFPDMIKGLLNDSILKRAIEKEKRISFLMIDLYYKKYKDESIKKYFTNIDASAHFLLGLINDALDSSQIEKNVLKLTYEPYCMSEFKRYVNSMVRSLCDAKNIEFNIVDDTLYFMWTQDNCRFLGQTNLTFTETRMILKYIKF